MNTQDKKREKLFKNLDNCLNSLLRYDLNSFMPLFYVLCKNHEEGYVSILNMDSNESIFTGKMRINPSEYESELQKEIYNSVDPAYFEGQAFEIVARFYETSCLAINDYYKEIIEYIIDFLSRKSSKFGIETTPIEVARLMAHQISKFNPDCVYDPCAGLGTYAIVPEFDNIDAFIGQEINPIIKVIAQIRLDAHERESNLLYQGDCTFDWREDPEFNDSLVSEIPFGVRLNDRSLVANRPKTMETYILQKFIESKTYNNAVLMLAPGFIVRHDAHDIRKTLCEKNYVESVIQLPQGVLYYTGIAPIIITLNKEKNNKDVLFIMADDCVINEGRIRKLDFESVIKRLNDKEKKQTQRIDVNKLFENHYSLEPSKYIAENFQLLPGQTLVKFMDLVQKVNFETNFSDEQGRIFQNKDLCNDITEIPTREHKFKHSKLTKNLVKVYGKCIIFNSNFNKFFIKYDDESLFVNRQLKCFKVNEEKSTVEYLAYSVLNFIKNSKQSVSRLSMSRINYDSLTLPIYENLDTQMQIIERIYRQETNELLKKIDRLKVLSGQSSDLIHNLGITFTKLSAAVSNLSKENCNISEARMSKNNPYEDTIEYLNDNLQFALRQINSTGADFSFVNPEMEKMNICELSSEYISAWENYGFQTFNVPKVINNVSPDTIVVLDKNLFYTIMDCIFINAHQHGFSKRFKEGNIVQITTDSVIYEGNEYVQISVTNNGNPWPDNFTLEEFVQRGIVGVNSSQDGLGGDHICKIIHHFEGFVSVETEGELLSIKLLIPIYITSEKTKFKELYGTKYL